MRGEDRDRGKMLNAGPKFLDSILGRCGFRFMSATSGVGSGGRFASGKYVREDRSLELHFRHSLGLVTYHIEDVSIDHETYMRMLGVRDLCRYPDFPKNPLDSFRAW